jgi:hypothetical protein
VSEEGARPQLAGVNIWAREPERLGVILRDGLGLGLRARTDADGTHFSARIGDLMLSIHPGEDSHTELAFTVTALQSAIAGCTARGGRLNQEISSMPYGTSAHLHGPAGFGVELVELRTPPNRFGPSENQ